MTWFHTLLPHHRRIPVTLYHMAFTSNLSVPPPLSLPFPPPLMQMGDLTRHKTHHLSESTYKHPEYKESDLAEAPKFTQSLNDRTTTNGYTTKLFCSVRGSPKPRIVWLKNKMEIGEDPKYRSLINQGVCSLEIRKPSPFDGGVYTCKAINPLGEASVNCKLDVKVPQ
ncbi:hypothetical protein GDO78_021573 [Eleutherodactylus coqui]|uniref:Ig-like domain-containing protein n=1 Tax=Eleutherodactylus coqui TaxID=57060 RepID=A0A8J6JSE5_ELECQ|nr:hypothetical protein GDO78_021573 [Eleutherodactylus coqui]